VHVEIHTSRVAHSSTFESLRSERPESRSTRRLPSTERLLEMIEETRLAALGSKAFAEIQAAR
jgi:hypothetical protein